MPKGDGLNTKWREMTSREAEALFFKTERDAIHRDWVQAENVIEILRIALSNPKQINRKLLENSLVLYDAYIAVEKAKAAEPSGLPEKGLVST